MRTLDRQVRPKPLFLFRPLHGLRIGRSKALSLKFTNPSWVFFSRIHVEVQRRTDVAPVLVDRSECGTDLKVLVFTLCFRRRVVP